ncbi:iron-siderophore ABC transporter substrate-binding protein [Nocardioides coralli]|uniref:iron-siderophore ABC transporter substrate-binding protein n=1 Tax=Nocardioides coralli TaxID=2872154 RepID=UPI001CA3FF42|nr:iron-siderophore ABC transporter substrate-binding protein [Nocardioides coralli]QZY28928.1 iron-siderophore ABC transporter substrate-binding protein [Nocardioides coralli]
MRSTRLLSAATAAATALVLAGCGSATSSEAGDDDVAAGSADAFPVTIEHVYGETTIEAKPERVATVAWANHEVPLALGVVPVGMSKATWGDDDGDGVLPWVEEQLAELDAETPVLFDETEGIDFEAVADTQPDVILASYSGLTQEDYDTLSKIAPVVAYPDVAWGTSVQDMIRLNSEAMGMAAEGDQLIEDLDATITEAYEAHPELAGKSAVFTYIDPNDLSQVGFYTTHDTRPGFLESVGMEVPEAVADASAGTEEFYTSISAEKGDQLDDADILVTYGDAEGQLVETLESDPLLSKIDAIGNGNVATLVDSTPLAASANPSPLSIPWGIDDYFALLAEAAA